MGQTPLCTGTPPFGRFGFVEQTPPVGRKPEGQWISRHQHLLAAGAGEGVLVFGEVDVAHLQAQPPGGSEHLSSALASGFPIADAEL